MTERINATQSFDVLSDILHTLRFRSTIFFRSSLAAPWGVSLGSMQFPRFHIAMSGSFYIGSDEVERPIEIKERGVVMLPDGCAHWIADYPGRQLISSSQAAEECQLSNLDVEADKIASSLMCGLVRFDEQTSHPFLKSLPTVIHIPCLESSSPIWRLIELIDDEIRTSNSLDSIVVDRMSEALFLKLIQVHVQQTTQSTDGFITALHDPRLHTALRLIHQRMDEEWTIVKLADSVGMSRATLVRHFHEAVGLPPIEYLTQWRLLKAHNLLKYSTLSLDRIAERVGFATKQTLTKAFKRQFGYTPVSLRHMHSATPTA
ncbi:cupin domain-containing protein [Pseudomonadota bacterium]